MKRLMHSFSHLSFSSLQLPTSIKTLVLHGLYPQALKVSVEVRDLRLIEQTYSLFVKSGFSLDKFLGSSIIDCFSKLGNLHHAHRFLQDMPETDTVVWNTLISGHSRIHETEDAFHIFNNLRKIGLKPDVFSLSSLLKACNIAQYNKSAHLQIQAHCCKTGYLSVSAISNALISMYGRCQCIEEAKRVFDEMVHRDCVSWNALLSGSAENGLIGLTLEMFYKMRHSFIKENKFTLASVLEVLSNWRAREQTKEIHAHIIKSGFISDDSMVTCLIRAYGKCDEIENMMHLFSEIYQVHLVHLNAILASLVHGGYYENALKFFRDTWDSKVAIDGITISLLLKACGTLSTLEQGKTIHSMALKCGINQDNFVGSALVDVYCKCGNIGDGRMAFDELSEDNMAAWNAMIMGYAQHGYVEEVFKLFNEMIILGINVDEITCLGFLYSCCHSGRVKEACSFLNSMSECHGVIPQLEHYACLVDLLGRVGELEEAKRHIDQMPVSPDAQIWQILLSACTLHGNVELGKVVSLKLLEMQPENNSAHVVLSHLHASVGVWEEAGRLREVMKENIIQKEPGTSWLQVKGNMHSFFANDSSHVESNEIRLKLQELNNQIRATTELEDFFLCSIYTRVPDNS
ncbi:hypothetical protein AQUCO_03800089v1 [Aquilegia coerulea]|uniref:Pentatricopeptide repeat-containing protein n=1 Tax=Aquilegia coerulea TaxID=218851 RepID=A0A2G5CSN8_AQUCA|nr:hypothetical protein AQUCO_03800089v1 [Aquilegia coerulea]